MNTQPVRFHPRRGPCRILAAAMVLALSAGASVPQAGTGEGVVASTNGGGYYLFADVLDIRFAFNARQYLDGSAGGRFHQSVKLGDLLVEFHGEVICLTVDPVNGRAWIGGVITRNFSDHPAFLNEIHEPGRDVWFRVLDNGEGQSAPDRTTFLGFEGGAGIHTSEEYCELQLWLDNDANTHPVTSGNIKVRP